jgi:hypothetical protein
MSLVISGIPASLNEKLIEEYLDLKKRFSMNDWGPGQLKGGRFAEVLLRIFQHLLGDLRLSAFRFPSSLVREEKSKG